MHRIDVAVCIVHTHFNVLARIFYFIFLTFKCHSDLCFASLTKNHFQAVVCKTIGFFLFNFCNIFIRCYVFRPMLCVCCVVSAICFHNINFLFFSFLSVLFIVFWFCVSLVSFLHHLRSSEHLCEFDFNPVNFCVSQK